METFLAISKVRSGVVDRGQGNWRCHILWQECMPQLGRVLRAIHPSADRSSLRRHVVLLGFAQEGHHLVGPSCDVAEKGFPLARSWSQVRSPGQLARSQLHGW